MDSLVNVNHVISVVGYCIFDSNYKTTVSGFVSTFASIEQTKDANDISLRIQESLKSKMGNSIDFENVILKNENEIKGEPRVYYSPRKY